MPVTVYRSTDPSAPPMSGDVNALINVLDKCLVTGYGSKAAAGWTKPFVGSSTAVFRQGGGNQFYLDINDNGPGTGLSREARLRGYEVMTAVATGTAPFPTVAQQANGLIIRKSTTATSTARVWTVIADDRTVYILTQPGDSPGMWYCFCFGDIYSYVSGTDSYRTMILGRTAENDSLGASENADNTTAALTSQTGHFIARNFTGVGGSSICGKIGDAAKAGVSGVGSLRGLMGLPHAVDGKVWIAPVHVIESNPIIRGKMRGFFHYLHLVATFADQDTVSGAGVYAGRTFLLFKTTGNASAYCFDITGPWDTN